MKRFLLGLIYTMTTVFSPGAFAVERIVTADLIEGQRSVKNYMKDKGHFEKNANGFASYADAAAASPVDGTGGSATNTCTQTTSSPLAGVGSFLITHGGTNRQGDGCSASFSIDSKDKARVLQVSFDYLVASGTYADGDQTVWLYDVTNSRLIQPTGSSILNASIAQKQVLEFQTSSDSTSYRLIFHTASTSASSYTVKIDDIMISPQIAVLGSSITEWKSFTPTGSWSTNTTWTGQWRRVGDSIEVYNRLALAGAPTSATLTANIPSVCTIDTAKINASGPGMLGVGHILDSGSDEYPLAVMYSSTTVVTMRTWQGTGATATASIGNNLTQAAPVTFANGDVIDFTYKAPCVGWGTAQVLSSDTDTRVAAMYAVPQTPTGTITSGFNIIKFGTVTQDSHGSYDTATGLYTVKVPGWYHIDTNINYACASGSVGNVFAVKVMKNGATDISQSLVTMASTSVLQYVIPVAATFYAVAGDTIGAYSYSSATTPTYSASSGNSALSINRLSGPSQIAASETVSAASGTTTPTSASFNESAYIIYPAYDHDTHGMCSTSTGICTIPVSGKYQMCVNNEMSTSSAGTFSAVAIYVDGSIKSYVESIGGTNQKDMHGCKTLALNAGQTIGSRFTTDASSPAVVGTHQKNFFSLLRVGN